MEGLVPLALRAMFKNSRRGHDGMHNNNYDRLSQSNSGRREPFLPDGSCGDHDDGTASKNRGRRSVNNSGRHLISRDSSRGTKLHQPLLLLEDAAFQLTCSRRCDDDEYRMSSEKLMQARRIRTAKKEEPPTVEEAGSEEIMQEELAAERNRRRKNPLKKFMASLKRKACRRAQKKTDDLPQDSELRPLLASFRIYSSESDRMVVPYSNSRSFW